MKSTLFLTGFFFLNHLFGQNFQLTGQDMIGNVLDDELHQVVPTNDGGKIAVFSSSNNDGDRSSLSYGNLDFWVVKYDNQHTIQWENSYGGLGGDVPSSVVELPDGSFVIGGVSNSPTGSGVRTLPTYGLNDFWVIKISSTGNLIWDKSFGTVTNPSNSEPGLDFVHSMALKNDTILLCGVSNGGISGSKTLASYGLTDIWLIGIDTDGTELFQRVYGGTGAENYPVIKVLNGKTIISCQSSSGVSGNKATPGYGNTDAWIFELDHTYAISNEKTFGGSSFDYLRDFVLKDGSYYFAGTSNSPAGGTKTSPNYGIKDAWVVKTDLSFQSTMQSSYGAIGDYNFLNIITRPNGKLLLTGYVSEAGTSTWKSRASMGETDFYLVGLDENGSYEWNYSWGGNYNDIGKYAFEQQHNQFEVFGTSKSSLSGDLTENNHNPNGGYVDGYRCLFTTNLSVPEMDQNTIAAFPNPFNEVITISAEQLAGQLVRITDAKGTLVFSKQMEKHQEEIDLAFLSTGIYLLQIDHFTPVRVIKN